MPALILTVTAALGLASCGGSSGVPAGASAQDVVEIEAAEARFARAVERRDVEAFCASLAPATVQRLGGGASNGRRECLRVWRPGRNPFFNAKDPDLTIVEITKFAPPYATASIATGGQLVLLREDGTWYVDIAPVEE